MYDHAPAGGIGDVAAAASAHAQGWGLGTADRWADETWVATQDWLGKPLTLDRDGAAEVARRYLAAYGPANAHDFATWSGLPVAAARAAVKAVATALRSDLRKTPAGRDADRP